MSQYKLNGENVAGFSQDGKDIKFTNTGTGLQADNVEDAIKEINTDLSGKLKGQNGRNNSTVIVENVNAVAALTMLSSSPSALSPSVEIDFLDNRMVIYRDSGNGWVQVGTVMYN